MSGTGTRESGTLSPVHGAWADLARLDIDEWLWIDTVEPGIHVARMLPAEPTQATHVWGWGPDRWVRARVDPSLGDGGAGVIGAMMMPGEDLEITVSIHPAWNCADGRVSVGNIPGLHGADGVATRDVKVRSVLVESETGPDGVELMPLAFIELV
ncbi:hypothetical protein [Propionicicella superfundia]|uniref:hypothetical protein n=1 Tax=Propionicicella superfundia TaxID=348582 RepID=UPI0004914503|nr:hypothetical protein [Propionicicella superfundia]